MEKSILNDSIIFKYQNPFDVKFNKGEINLCVSVFYNKLNWHTLVLKGIVPFRKRNNIRMFFLLSESRGAHLRLVIVTSEKEAQHNAKLIDNYLKEFLKNNPSEKVIDEVRNSNIFMDFKNNSVQYGLFDVFLDSSMLQFNIGLSELLIFTFNEFKESFHFELNEIIIQIITIFCNALEMSDEDASTTFKNILNAEYLNYSNEKLLKIKKINQQDFEENKEVLIEYFKDYRFRKHYEEAWEREWYNFVFVFFKDVNGLSYGKKEARITYAINTIMEVFNVGNRVSVYNLLSEGIEKYNLN